jgi:hypothetical protein
MRSFTAIAGWVADVPAELLRHRRDRQLSSGIAVKLQYRRRPSPSSSVNPNP